MTIVHHEPLARRNTFRVGGEASSFLSVFDIADLKEGVAYAKAEHLPVFVLGEGSNVLIADRGFSGMVLHMGNAGVIWDEKGDTAVCVAEAGAHFDTVVAQAVEKGYAGMENLSGIPGTVGASPIQNIGAYGVEVREVVEWVEVFDQESNAVIRMESAQCAFSYRDSIFKSPEGKKYIVVRVAYRLHKNFEPKLQYKDITEYFTDKPAPTLADIRSAVLEIRARKFPDLSVYGCAGSFFKNPILSPSSFSALHASFPTIPSYPLQNGAVKIPAAWLIERFGWKGKREGDVGAYHNHSLVIVNYGSATAREVQQFAQKIIDDVFEKTNVRLEPEVQVFL